MSEITKNVEITRVFNAPLDIVWKLWTESEMVKQWWGPTGFTCPVAEMHVAEGNTSLVCMRAPQEFGGMDMFNTWTYTKVVPGERLEYTLRFTDKDGIAFSPAAMGMPAGVPEEVPHVISFAEADGSTTVTVVEKGYTTDEAVNISRPGMEQCLDKMEAIIAKSE
jgi:uncharacterized protein YndB with AHSA1/START domain